jgi:clan AA aspartic protease
MGKVMTKVKLTNDHEAQLASVGALETGRVRSVVLDALVDTGATMLTLPADVCRDLGLPHRGTRRVRYADGRVREVPWVGGILLEILGRQMTCDALVENAGTMPLIGQIPLEGLDLVVNPETGDLMPDPASPDAPLLDLLAAGDIRCGG